MSQSTATELDLEHANALFYSGTPQGLGICGCGNPENAFALVRDLLNLAPFYEDPDAVRTRIGEPGAYHLVLSLLENAGLIEHGGGIGGSWLTPKGDRIRSILNVANWEQVDDAGLPHNGADCSETCWA